jgi:hypothetical protein
MTFETNLLDDAVPGMAGWMVGKLYVFNHHSQAVENLFG